MTISAIVVSCLTLFLLGYAFGKFVGIKQTYDYLEETGKIISKDELAKLKGGRNI